MRVITVRRLVAEDAAACVGIRREALERDPASFSASPSHDRGSDLGLVRASLSDTTAAVTFGAFDAELVGIVGISRERGEKLAHKANVWGMYVRPSHRRRGIGGDLMRAVIDQARQWPGVVQVHLSVSEDAPGALQMYQSLGFESWGTEPRALRLGDRFLYELHLVLPLV